MAKHGRPFNISKWSKGVQKGPKGSKMVNLDVFDHLEPFWVGVDPIGPFQTKNDFLFKSTPAKPYFVLMGQQIDFCPEWSKSVQMGPKGSQHLGLIFWTFLDLFGPLWNVNKPAMFGHFLCFIDVFFWVTLYILTTF